MDPIPFPLVVTVVDLNDNTQSIAVDTLSSASGAAGIFKGAAVAASASNCPSSTAKP